MNMLLGIAALLLLLGALGGAIDLYSQWKEEQAQRAEKRLFPEPKRRGKVFPDEMDIELAVEIVNGKRSA